MKRSEINAVMKDAIEFIESHGMVLPPFGYWTPEDWEDKGSEYDEIRDNMLGWDITDFGSGDYSKVGLFMFTIRNGSMKDPKYKKPYAEKILITDEGQVTPYHFHWSKMEDIINCGGGTLLVQLYNSTEDGKFADTDVLVSMDGRNYLAPAGTVVKVVPGQSITLHNGVYHQFWGEEGKGKILIREVSKVNDDNVDNRFYEEVGRFPTIEEDEKPLHLLYNDYKMAE